MTDTFDHVFGSFSTQQEVFDQTVRPIVEEALRGFNTTVFAYGQTGTGKTHTMTGVVDDPDLMGIAPRAVHAIFESLENTGGGSDQDTKVSKEFNVRVSFLELYNEELQGEWFVIGGLGISILLQV